MFASFIDQKILSHLDSKKSDSFASSPRDQEYFVVFESRLKFLRDDLRQSADQRPRRFYRTAAAKEAGRIVRLDWSLIDFLLIFLFLFHILMLNE